MIRILEITSELDGGGVERLLFDYCKKLIDTKEFAFDFVVTSKNKGILEKPLEQYGCSVFHLPQYREGIKKHNKELTRILDSKHYDAIHDHGGYKAFFNLKIGKRKHIKCLIAHSHQSNIPESFKQKVIRKVFTFFTKKYATDLFCCGKDAGIWMWGEKDFKKHVFVMKNCINSKDFAYNETVREKYRNEFNIKRDEILLGNIARFSYQKNQKFLVEVMSRLVKKNPNYKLLFVGDGELRKEIENYVKDKEIENFVIFAGVRSDASSIYNALDCFILTSRYEGLPVTVIEAQANGVSMVLSEAITKESINSKNCLFLSLNQSADDWANGINSLMFEREFDFDFNDLDINFNAEKLGKKYKEIILCQK